MGAGEDIIPFHIANNAATHLGRKLYSTTPPALAELVANSYDAYATKSNVILNESDRVIVADNGIGMSLDDLKSRYAEVGKIKKEDTPPSGMNHRRPMGKKGIGKLASFSLGNSYTVYTRTSSEQAWRSFTVKYVEMTSEKNATQYRVESTLVNDLPDFLSQFNAYTSGFITIVTGLRRKLTARTRDELRTQLARRFSLRDVDFTMYVDNEEIDMQRKEFFYDHVQALTYTGYDEINLHTLFGDGRNFVKETPENISSNPLLIQEFQTSNPSQVLEDRKYLVNEHNVRGWIGIFDKPSQLKKVGLGGVVVYINGKVADEDFLKEHKDAQMGSQYIVGEFVADYLNDQSEEPITSSRQGLDEADSDVARLAELAVSMRATAIKQWNELHQRTAVSKMPAFIKNDQQYKKWLSSLSPAQKTLNGKFLSTIADRRDFENSSLNETDVRSLVNSFTQVIEQVGTDQISHQIDLDSADSVDSEALFRTIALYFGRVATQEKLRQAGIIEQRLRAIEHLQRLMDDPSTLEKAFEQQLYDNPWLLNPYWSQSTHSKKEIEMKRQYFLRTYNNQDEEYKRNYMDIYVETADDRYPIIVELKKNEPTGHAKVTRGSIEMQIERYRSAIVEHMDSSDKAEIGDHHYDIKAFFIFSEDFGLPGQGNRITFRDEEVKILQAENITLLTYRDLVVRAQRAYRDFLKVLDDEQRLPYFPVDETARP